jgi:hypothetical protein
MAKKALEGARARVMPTPFGIRVDFDQTRKLSAPEVKKALLAAVNAIPTARLRGFTNGRITMLV